MNHNIQQKPISSVWKLSWALLKNNLSLVGLFLIVFLIFNIASLFYAYQMPMPVPHKVQPMNEFLLVLLYLVLIYFMGVAYHQIGTVLQEKPSSLQNSMMTALKKYPHILLASILFSLSILIGGIFLLVPGIFLLFALAPYLALIILDNENALTAYKHSIQLVWGSWWRVFFLFLVPGVIINALFMFVIIGSVMLATILHAHNHLFLLIEGCLFILLDGFLFTYIAALNVAVFYDLKKS